MRRIVGCGALALALVGALAKADDQVVMAHSGRLFDGSDQPLTGPVKLTFRIVDQSAQVASEKELWNSGACTVDAEKGFYSVVLGSGECGSGLTAQMLPLTEARYLEIAIDSVKLSPRLRLASVPTAVLAGDAQNLGGKPAASYAQKTDVEQAVADLTAQLQTKFSAAGGTIAGNAVVQGSLQAGATTVDSLIASGTISGKFAGDGSALTKLAAAQLTGTVPDAAIPAGVALLSDGQTFQGTKTFTNLTATGTITGKVVGDGSGLTSLSAAQLTGTIAPARLPAASASAAGAMSPADKARLDAGLLAVPSDGRPASPAANSFILNARTGAIEFFDGTRWSTWQRRLPTSCKDALATGVGTADGLYTIQTDWNQPATQVYCDMTTAGGGWTLVSYGYRATANGNSNAPYFLPNAFQGTWDPATRNNAAAIDASALLRVSKEAALTVASSQLVTGNMLSYATAHAWTMPNPSATTLDLNDVVYNKDSGQACLTVQVKELKTNNTFNAYTIWNKPQVTCTSNKAGTAYERQFLGFNATTCYGACGADPVNSMGMVVWYGSGYTPTTSGGASSPERAGSFAFWLR